MLDARPFKILFQKKLFSQADAVDRDWLSLLSHGSRDMASRYAVFAFLAGFWRQDYRSKLARFNATQPISPLGKRPPASVGRD